jgi:hypothetical protein
MFVTEFALIPYTIFVGGEKLVEKNKLIELLIDLIHTLNMGIIICTAIKPNEKLLTQFSDITLEYLKSPLFYIDIIGSWPTMFTYYRTYYWFYYFKLLRLADYSRFSFIIERFGEMLLDGRTDKISRMNGQYLVKLLSAMFVTMHGIACIWISIGESLDDSWINSPENGIGSDSTEKFKYVTSFYWVMTTLTTVGYGDQKGYSSIEYGFTMGVEFVGILVFTITMSFVKDVLVTDDDDGEQEEGDVDAVNAWLIKLDNARMNKKMPEVLYDKIKVYINESITYDHKKLIGNFEFFNQLKPSLRAKLVKKLFKKPFLKDFDRMFSFNDMSTGQEFKS